MPPGRPRRKPKIPPPAQPQTAQPQAHTQMRYYKPVKEEPISNIHDESDLISFRNEALSRFVKNQELLENVTSKYIHSSKIIPPSSVPGKLKTDDLDELKYDDVFFGDLKLLQKMSEKIDTELKVQDIDIQFPPEYEFQQQSVGKLAKLTKKITSEAELIELQKEYQQILTHYQEKYHKTIDDVHGDYKKVEYNPPGDIKVESAPADYDPRSVNSMLNMKPEEPQITQSLPMPMPMPMAMEDNNNNGEFFDSNFLGFQGQKDVMDEIVDDDMGLMNFQADDMMDDNFDEDFLSQIDHSME